MASKQKPRIYIKPSKRGSLRRAMGAKKGEKLSVSALRAKLKTASPAMKKKIIFALNARRWKKKEAGGLIDDVVNFEEGGPGGPGSVVTIQDTRVTDPITGRKIRDTERMHIDIPVSVIRKIGQSAVKYGIDPYTALAIYVQERGSETNPFNLFDFNDLSMRDYERFTDDPIDVTMKYMARKFKHSVNNLNKRTEEEIVQAWNGYGVISNKGKMYGIDTNKTPINMWRVPLYGMRIKDLKDNMILQHPEVKNIIDSVLPRRETVAPVERQAISPVEATTAIPRLASDIDTTTLAPMHGGGGTLAFKVAVGALNNMMGTMAEVSEMKEQQVYNEAAKNMSFVDVGTIGRMNRQQALMKNWWNLGLGAIGSGRKGRMEAEMYNKQLMDRINNMNIASRLSTISTGPEYAPVVGEGGYLPGIQVKKAGGFIVYKGDTHKDVSGGILVDKMGNPVAVSNRPPVALVEGGGKNKKGEVVWIDPDTKVPYVFPHNNVGTADKARKLVSKYKLDKPGSQYRYDPLLEAAVNKQFQNLAIATEFAKETNMSKEDLFSKFGKGGQLTPAKAKEILKDGTIRGKKLTPKQRKFFQALAHGWEPRELVDGGLIPINQFVESANIYY